MKRLVTVLLIGILGILSTAGCAPPGKAALLGQQEAVYVPIDPGTLLSLKEALARKGYGQTTAEDLKLIFTYRDADFGEQQGRALVVYSDEAGVPDGTTFTPMRVWQLYEAALDDEIAAGIVVDPDVAGKASYAISGAELRAALPKLSRQPALLPGISRKQGT